MPGTKGRSGGARPVLPHHQARGPKRQYASLDALLTKPYVIELKSLDMSVYIETPATLLNGDGSELEFQFKMQNALGETVDVIGTLRPREEDD